MRAALVILAAITLIACAKPAFKGRLILEHMTAEEIAANSTCQSAWDIKPGQHATACSWTFETLDGLGCHIIYSDASGLEEELRNCGGIDQKVMKR